MINLGTLGRTGRQLTVGLVAVLVLSCCGGSEVSRSDLEAAEERIEELEAENEALRQAASSTSTSTTTSVAETTTTSTTSTTIETTTTTSTTTSTTTTTIARPEITPETVQMVINPPAQEWLARPSGPTYDSLAAAAQTMLDTHDGDYEIAVGSFERSATEYLKQIAVYPGADWRVWDSLEKLGIAGTPIYFGSGTYRVGSESGMVPPGTYVAESDTAFDGCYWETLDANGNIIDNNFIGSGFRVVASVSSRAFSVEFSRCGIFVKQ